MRHNLGVVRPGSTLYFPFDTFDRTNGAPVTMTGFAVGDIQVYKDGGTTQRASTSGYTLLDTDGTDFDAITGLHGYSIDLSDNTTAGFWAAGSRYMVAISTVTVDAQTMSFWHATFRIGYEGATFDTTIATLSTQTSFTLTTGPAENSALNGCQVVIHDIASAVQYAYGQVTGYTGATKTVTLGVAPTFTVAAGDNISIFRPALLSTTLGTTLDVSSGGEAGVDWSNIGNKTAIVDLANTTIATTQKVDVDTIKTQTVTLAGGVTIPAATLASTTNITAGTVTTATNVTTVNGLAANVVTAASLAADAGAELADALLDRDMSTGVDSGSTTVRTVRQALRFLRNKWSISGATLTVTKEDDATSSWTATVTTDAAADPITASDPGGP